jgi:repressor LexA
VVARINDEVTVKRLQRKGGLVLLEAENPDFAPIEVDPRRDQFALEGLAVGLLRNTHGF